MCLNVRTLCDRMYSGDRMKIYILGDSISAAYTPEQAPQEGWGQELGSFLPETEIINKAAGGRSTKSYISEGRLAEVEKILEAGDIVLVQFAHNDWNPIKWRYCEADIGYKDNLRIFVDTARQYGAVPVLLSPICMRIWQDGQLQPTHSDYPKAMRQVASEKGAAFIDMYKLSYDEVETLGEENSKRLYLYTPDGSKRDDAHTSIEGAKLFARIIADELIKLGLVKGGAQ